MSDGFFPDTVEKREQDAVVEWFHLQYPKELIVKIPNDLVRGVVNASINKRNGLVGGMPDLMICATRCGFGAMFVEMKRGKSLSKRAGKVAGNQKRIIELLTEKGYHCVVAYGFDEAMYAISLYMQGKVL